MIYNFESETEVSGDCNIKIYLGEKLPFFSKVKLFNDCEATKMEFIGYNAKMANVVNPHDGFFFE